MGGASFYSSMGAPQGSHNYEKVQAKYKGGQQQANLYTIDNSSTATGGGVVNQMSPYKLRQSTSIHNLEEDNSYIGAKNSKYLEMIKMKQAIEYGMKPSLVMR